MRHRSIPVPNSTRGGTSQQMEVFLHTAIQGLRSQETDQAGEEAPKRAGSPSVLPSASVWLAVLVGIVRGFPSIRAVWR